MNYRYYNDVMNAIRTSHGQAAVMIGDTKIPIAISNVQLEHDLFSRHPDITFEASVLYDANHMVYGYQHGIKKVIFNNPATIVLWSDGTKTVVKCQEGDVYDPEKGLAMAISKKALGNKGNFNEVFKKWLPDEEILYPKLVAPRGMNSGLADAMITALERMLSDKEVK